MLSAKELSERIRMRRKELKDSDETVDTSPHPKMNPQDIWNKEKMAQHEETIPGAKEAGERVGPSSPVMEEEQKDDSQDLAVLKKHMSRIARILGKLSMSDKSGNY